MIIEQQKFSTFLLNLVKSKNIEEVLIQEFNDQELLFLNEILKLTNIMSKIDTKIDVLKYLRKKQ